MTEEMKSTYTVIKELGQGGGGVVYLAEHRRLKKLVVIKADKRRVSASPNAVAQEMNILKNLSHMYIPQLYDFFIDEATDTAYTVMDYVEGESLNRPLKRGEQFTQAQLIQWACQLLEALDYLHTRKPHNYVHGDIKPSNIMLTPQGDIRLIDFNISLALGGDNAILGYTKGYASPEHYHYAQTRRQLLSCAENENVSSSQEKPLSDSLSSSSPFEYALDARSDIYSLGATLYHLISGRRPERNAEDVTPLKSDIVSPALVKIIQKAMAPNPNDRFQTAAEMLDAIRNIVYQDVRYIRFRRVQTMAAAALTIVFLIGGVLAFIGQRQMTYESRARELAAQSENALRNGDADNAVSLALAALPKNPECPGLFDPPDTAAAQRALANALGAYHLTSAWEPSRLLPLPAEPVKTAFSADGHYTAALAGQQILVFDTESGLSVTNQPLQAYASPLADFAFREDTLLYAAPDGLSAADLRDGTILWNNGKPVTSLTLSASGKIAAGISPEGGMAMLFDAENGESLGVAHFNGRVPYTDSANLLTDAGGRIFALSADGQWLAVSFEGGGLTLFCPSDFLRGTVLLDTSAYSYFEGGFCGSFFAWCANGSDGAIFSVFDTESGMAVNTVYSDIFIHVKADETGIFVSGLPRTDLENPEQAAGILTRLNPVTWSGTEITRANAALVDFVCRESGTFARTADGRCLAFDTDGNMQAESHDDTAPDFIDMSGSFLLTANRNELSIRIQRKADHTSEKILSYDASFFHTKSRVSSDLSRILLSRFDAIRVLSLNGGVIADIALPDSDNVYSLYYRKDADVMEARYFDGLIRSYSAKDGTLISELPGEPPDKTEPGGTIVTEDYVISDPGQGVATAYTRDGEIIGGLDMDGYPYDAVQIGDNLITLVLRTDGSHYGRMWNPNGEVLAELPDLSDAFSDGTLFFDDAHGGIYQGHVYSLSQLLRLAT